MTDIVQLDVYGVEVYFDRSKEYWTLADSSETFRTSQPFCKTDVSFRYLERKISLNNRDSLKQVLFTELERNLEIIRNGNIKSGKHLIEISHNYFDDDPREQSEIERENMVKYENTQELYGRILEALR